MRSVDNFFACRIRGQLPKVLCLFAVVKDTIQDVSRHLEFGNQCLLFVWSIRKKGESLQRSLVDGGGSTIPPFLPESAEHILNRRDSFDDACHSTALAFHVPPSQFIEKWY